LNSYSLEKFPPAISFVRIDTSGDQSRIIVADLFSRKMYWLDSSMTLLDSITTYATIVDAITLDNNTTYLCDIGEINPNNRKLGSIGPLTNDTAKKRYKLFTRTIKELARPVQLSIEDFNNDKRPDLLVCEFGFMKGSLSLYTSGKSNNYTKTDIRPVAGAIKTYVDDYNKDGHPDIWALFAQGEYFCYKYWQPRTFTETSSSVSPVPWLNIFELLISIMTVQRYVCTPAETMPIIPQY
jgi:hypothetical protein